MANKAGRNHVMLSYQWDHQAVVKRIKEELDRRGYNTWMDLSNMTGDINQAMAEGVEGADVIVMCASNAYKVSFNCQKEMGYADAKRKDLIPLKMEKDVEFDGWLGPIMGSKLWIDFSDEMKFDKAMEQLYFELTAKGVQVMSTKESNSGLVSLDVDSICEWLVGLQLDESIVTTFRQNCVTGEDLVALTEEDLMGDDFKISQFKTKKILRKRDEILSELSTGVSPSTPKIISNSSPTITPRRTESQTKSARPKVIFGPPKDHGTSSWTVGVVGKKGNNPGEFNCPLGMAWAPSGRLLVADTNNSRIQILNTDFRCVDMIILPPTVTFPQPFIPWDIAISHNSLYFVYDAGNKQIIVLNDNKEIIRTICKGENLWSIALMGDKILATDRGGHRLTAFTTTGEKIAEIKGDEVQVGRFESPRSVAVTNNNEIVMSHNHGINIYNSDLKFVSSFGSESCGGPQLCDPTGVCIDKRNNIYVCDRGNNRVIRVTEKREFAVVPTEIVDPEFIAISDGKTTRIAITQTWGYNHVALVLKTRKSSKKIRSEEITSPVPPEK